VTVTQSTAHPPDRPRSSGWWAVAMAVIGVICLAVPVLMIRGAMRKARELDPVRMAKETLAATARSLVEGFRTGTVETTFRSYATELKDVSKFQFAELKQLESFERKDSTSVAWGTIPLPDVVVEARGQVTYVYTLDLKQRWNLRLEGRKVEVVAPAPEFNAPSLDPSSLTFETKQGSVLRDEAAVKESLRTALSQLLAERARRNLPLVRETGRKATEDFVRAFLLSSYDDARDLEIRVRFADESAMPSPASPELPARR
jgi:hypothetical protein